MMKEPFTAPGGRLVSVLLLGVVLVTAMAGCDDEGTSPPPVSHLELSLADTLLAPGDSTLLEARVVGTDGRSLDLALSFEAEDPEIGALRVDSATGRTAVVRALGSGDTRIVARTPEGVTGFVPFRVRTITGFQPAFGAPGTTVTVHGKGFGPQSRVFFGFPPGEVRSVAEDGRSIRAWVPWEAENKPLRLVLQDGTEVRTDESFVLTGRGDDGLEPNTITLPTPVELPFRNPYLITRLVSLDNFSYHLDEPGPVTIRVRDREELSLWPFRLSVQLNEIGGVGEVYGVVPARSFARDERQDAVISLGSFPAGRYAARVFVNSGRNVIDRRYEIDIDHGASFLLEPDGREPNDVPAMAPVLELPTSDSLALENPWTQDYYRVRVEERSRIVVRIHTLGHSRAVFFYQDPELRSMQWHLTNGSRPQTLTGRVGFFSPIEIPCTVEAGEYVVAVLENDGVESPYRMEVEATPTDSDFFNCRQPTVPPDGFLLNPAIPVPEG